MPGLHLLCELSRNYCIGICAFLVPAILIITLQSLLLVIFQRRRLSLTVSVVLAFGFISLMVGHVATWFTIGVITPVTFILLTLALTCLTVNTWLWLRFSQQRSLWQWRAIKFVELELS